MLEIVHFSFIIDSGLYAFHEFEKRLTFWQKMILSFMHEGHQMLKG